MLKEKLHKKKEGRNNAVPVLTIKPFGPFLAQYEFSFKNQNFVCHYVNFAS